MPRSRHYPSDLTDSQWALVEPLLPAPAHLGRPEEHPRRDIVDAILYVARSGGSWRQLPADYPPWQTVYWHFARWEKDGVTRAVHDALRSRLRADEGRSPEPTAGIMDSQSVKAADTVGRDSRGYDKFKNTNGRTRFVLTDTIGLLLAVLVTSAGVHDTAGGRKLLLQGYFAGRRLRHVFTDSGFAGTLVGWAARLLSITVEVVRRPPGQRGFQVLPRRWVVERTLAWLTAHRRLARDYERTPEHSEAFIHWAMIGTMVRRIDRGHPATRQKRRPLLKVS